MGAESYLILIIFTIPQVLYLLRYLRKQGAHKLGKGETAGIVTCTLIMLAGLIYTLAERIFF